MDALIAPSRSVLWRIADVNAQAAAPGASEE